MLLLVLVPSCTSSCLIRLEGADFSRGRVIERSEISYQATVGEAGRTDQVVLLPFEQTMLLVVISGAFFRSSGMF